MTIYTTPNGVIRTIHKDDPDFHITNGITIAPRAGFEIAKPIMLLEKIATSLWL